MNAIGPLSGMLIGAGLAGLAGATLTIIDSCESRAAAWRSRQLPLR
jgi:hypothetical protein